jgi:hypothetical protein
VAVMLVNPLPGAKLTELDSLWPGKAFVPSGRFLRWDQGGWCSLLKRPFFSIGSGADLSPPDASRIGCRCTRAVHYIGLFLALGGD